MPKAKTRKRRCKICKRWFPPDVRHADRQRTCGPECRRELHRRRCAEYNEKNRKSAKADYLQKKLDEADPGRGSASVEKIAPSLAGSRIDLDLPRDVIGNAIGFPLLVVIEYIIEQILRRSKIAGQAGERSPPSDRPEPGRRFQDASWTQPAEFTSDIDEQGEKGFQDAS
jgi:hypothetical protein